MGPHITTRVSGLRIRISSLREKNLLNSRGGNEGKVREVLPSERRNREMVTRCIKQPLFNLQSLLKRIKRVPLNLCTHNMCTI